jgi:PKD repeat protein
MVLASRFAAGALIVVAAGILASVTLARSNGAAASASYYGYCPDGGASAVYYGYCPPTNTTPDYTAPADQTSDEGENKSFALGSFTDPDNGPWQVTVTWGDGSPADTFPRSTAGALPATAHTYAENGTYAVHVTVTDSNGASDSGTFQVTVANLPPSCGPITGAPVAPVPVGTPVVTNTLFTDPGVLDTHGASMSWGDGTSSAGTVTESNGSGNVTASHTYTAAGVFGLTLTVTDDDGGSGTCSYEFVVVFNPNGGFVTGGGWITSPPGAFTDDASLTGKATFGFVAKYKKGSNVPDGNTEFQFQAGDLKFKSSSYDFGSLVISSFKAMYKGSGTINGTGDYAFKVTAIDGDIFGGGGADKFRIKITNKATSAVVYDNQLGAGDFSDAATALDGGSITIHKG